MYVFRGSPNPSQIRRISIEGRGYGIRQNRISTNLAKPPYLPPGEQPFTQRSPFSLYLPCIILRQSTGRGPNRSKWTVRIAGVLIKSHFQLLDLLLQWLGHPELHDNQPPHNSGRLVPVLFTEWVHPWADPAETSSLTRGKGFPLLLSILPISHTRKGEKCQPIKKSVAREKPHFHEQIL